MSNLEIQQIEDNLKSARKTVERGVSLERLFANRDFKNIVLDGYFEQEAIRLVHLKADPNMQTVDSQKSILTQMDAIGNLKQYFNTIRQFAAIAAKNVASDEEALAELRGEE